MPSANSSSGLNPRLCGCSFIHPGKSLQEGLQTVKNLGFSSVDIAVGGSNRHYDPVQIAQSPILFADRVRRHSQDSELHLNECFVLNFGVPINTPNKAHREETSRLFKGLCRFARRVGFQSILLIPGPTHSGRGQQGSFDLAIIAFQDLIQITGEFGLNLNVEADFESCANTPEAAAQLCQSVPELGLTLDYSHFICQGIAAERVAALHPYTRHIHIRQAAPGQIVAEIEHGSIDYAEVVSQLEKNGYDGLYCIEYLSFANDRTTLRQSEARTLAMSEEIKIHLDGLKDY